MGFLVKLFGSPKPTSVVIIRNRVGEEIDRVEGVWDLSGQNLKHRQWMHAELSGLSLAGADCEGINHFGARLVKACFCRANLRSSEISFADVSGADFRNADLTDATMYRTEVWRARFDDALLSEKSDIPGLKICTSREVKVAATSASQTDAPKEVQKQSIQGRVVDAKSGQPIRKVNVDVVGGTGDSYGRHSATTARMAHSISTI
jgi:pentapeptide repeat protein